MSASSSRPSAHTCPLFVTSRLRPVCLIPLPLMHSHVCHMSFEGQGDIGPLAPIAASPSPPGYFPSSVIHGLAPARHESRLLWAACCLGFFGFLRVGEFTARDGSSPLNPDIIGVHDISRAPGDPPNYICVHLRVSKTDPFGRGVHIYLGRTASVICPVAAILSFMTIRPSHLTGPLLRFLDGSTLTRTFLISTVKRALATASIDPTRYSGHSFRIGAATSAALAGMPDHTIKMLGRWESSAYALYVWTPAEELASVSARLLAPRPSTTPTISPGPTH